MRSFGLGAQDLGATARKGFRVQGFVGYSCRALGVEATWSVRET